MVDRVAETRRRGLLALTLALTLAAPVSADGKTDLESALGLEVSGLELRVVDVPQAVDFLALYGFTVDTERSADAATVRNGAAVIDVVKVTRRVDIDDRLVANTHINLRVENLDTAIAELRSKAGYQFVGELHRPFPLGRYAIVKDPSGNTFHLIEPSEVPAGGLRRGIFNIGITLPDMVKAREFYRDHLGFEIFSEDYFPPDLPLKRRGTLPLVLHQTADRSAAVGYPEAAAAIVVITTPDLERAAQALEARGIRFLEPQVRVSPRGRSRAFTDPFGIVFQLRTRDRQTVN